MRGDHPQPGHAAPTLEELQGFLDAEGVAKYTWPESVEVFDEFPRTPSLKVVKRDVGEPPSSAGHRSPRDERAAGGTTSSATWK